MQKLIAVFILIFFFGTESWAQEVQEVGRSTYGRVPVLGLEDPFISDPAPFTVSQAAVSAACPTDKAGLTDGWDINGFMVSKNTSAMLNYFAKGEIGTGQQVAIFYLAFYKELIDNEGFVIGTCGAGIRLAIKYSTLQGSVSVTLPFFAAQGQRDSNSVEIRVRTFGLSGPAVDAAVPSLLNLSTFDVKAFGELYVAMYKISQAYVEDAKRKQGEPRQIITTPRLFDTTVLLQIDFTASLVEVRALQSIENGDTCRTAQRSIPKRTNATNNIVAQTYQEVAGECRKSKVPSEIAKLQAKKILGDYLVKPGTS